MLTSLLFHHPNQPFRIFLLVPSSFSETNKKNIIDSLSPWATEVEFILISAPEFSGLKVSGHISSATYYRLYGLDLLPSNIKTALYLDSDIIINSNILDLLNIDISTYVLAAVTDGVRDKDEIVRSKLFLSEKAHYLNAGVLLLNVERWRSEKIGLRALQYCISNPDSITYHDQCAINHIIQGKFYVLDEKWNSQSHSMTRISPYRFHPSALKEASSAAIIHFSGPDKPWLFFCVHPMKDLYFKYLKYTVWRDFTEVGRTPRNMVRKFLGVHFPATAPRVDAAYMFGKRIVGAVVARVSRG
jgi:lipopolysaccharide biosynthesis glycosyltransferase